MNDEWQRLEPLLRSGEWLRWTGRPDPAVNFAPVDMFMIPFSILWCGFAVFWLTMAVNLGAPIFFMLFGAVFVLVGLYFVFGRFLFKRRDKRSTVYGLTDSRAIVAKGARSSQDIPLAGSPTQVKRSRDGRHATILFGQGKRPNVYQNTGLDFFMAGSSQVGFFDVADPETLLRELDSVRSGEGP